MGTVSKSTKELYVSLRSEVIGIRYRLTILRQLFTSQDVVGLLNKTAFRFFNTLRNDLLDTIVLMVNRLLEPAKSFNRYPNASFQKLIDSISLIADSNLTTTLKDLLDEIKAKSARLEYWRDKWVGHRDYDILLGLAPKPAISLPEFDEVLSLIGKFMNEFEQVYQDSHMEVNLYDNHLSAQELDEMMRFKIYSPQPYTEIEFYPDDGNAIIDLVRNQAPKS